MTAQNDPLSPGRREATLAAEPMMDVKDVAALLSTTVGHIRRLVAERRIRFHKVGGKVRFWRHEVEAWVASTLVPAGRDGQDAARVLQRLGPELLQQRPSVHRMTARMRP